MRYQRAFSISRRQRTYGLIHSGGFSAILLAQWLGVFEQTVCRDITPPRARGYLIRSVKQGRRWAYHFILEPATGGAGTGPADA